MLDAFLAVYHGISHFFGTIEGELIKRTAELVLLVIVSYMIVSEYRRERTESLRYLLYGFATLAIQKLLLSIVIAFVTFGGIDIKIFSLYLPIIYRSMELFSLVLIANAFVFPVKKELKHAPAPYLTKVKWILLSVLGFFFILQLLWLFWLSHYPAASIPRRGLFTFLELLDVLVLSYPIWILARNHKFDKYNRNVMIAFAVFLATPVINIINHLFFHGASAYLRVLAHPFPFISIILFTRVVYLKLVDKATLKSELSETKRKYEETKEISKLKDEFVSVVSHELRTPLTSMRLYTSLLLEGKMGQLSKEQEDTLRVIASENTRLTNLINDILRLSKLENKKMKITKKQCDLSELADYGSYRNLAEQKGITIINTVPKRFMITVDPDKFKQIFINLFSNAVKYTNHGGSIFLDARKSKKTWEFIVRDTGIGIKQEDVNKIFDKFYQVEDYMTRKEGGTGLGLPIVKRIVELHGGTIKVTSKPGKGSTFIVRMPN